jgi:hypothetical protein
MTLIAPQVMNVGTWAEPTTSTPTASDTIQAPGQDGKLFVYLKGGAGTATITIVLPTQTDFLGRTLANPTASLTASTGRLFIPLQPEMADSTGTITITNSAPTGCGIAVVQIA